MFPVPDTLTRWYHSPFSSSARQIPVVIYYTTAVVWPDGKVGFFDDVYKDDARLESVLAKGYPFAP